LSSYEEQRAEIREQIRRGLRKQRTLFSYYGIITPQKKPEKISNIGKNPQMSQIPQI
jgi:hypothetical protein